MQVLTDYLNGIYNHESSPKKNDGKVKSQTVHSLINEAYAQFGQTLTTAKIEELRNKHRRKTVHQFEEDTENSVAKIFKDNEFFDKTELRMLLMLIREEKQNIKKKSSDIDGLVETINDNDTKSKNENPSSRDSFSKVDSYRVDFDTFRIIFNELSPWGKCCNVDLAEKLFTVNYICHIY
jgi:TBC1 domain family member 8/9